MKVTCISDTHSNYFNTENIESCDLLIHAGDLEAWNENSLHKFIKWYNSFDSKYKVCIAGNHDKFIYENNALAKQIFKENNIIYLENSMIEIEEIKIWGSPITPVFFNWYFMAERGDAIKKYWDAIPENIDILLTHGPAYGILDYVSNTYNVDHHAGCEELLKAVERIKVKYHIFGHIHSSNGKYQTKDTTFINASVLDEDYCLEYEPKIINI